MIYTWGIMVALTLKELALDIVILKGEYNKSINVRMQAIYPESVYL